MSKLIHVTDARTPDRLLMLVPDLYEEADVHEACEKMDMNDIEIHETVLAEHITGTLRDMGIKEWREYWG